MSFINILIFLYQIAVLLAEIEHFPFVSGTEVACDIGYFTGRVKKTVGLLQFWIIVNYFSIPLNFMVVIHANISFCLC